MNRKQWFINRICKRVFPTIICDCQACKSYYDSGFVIDNEFEAIALYDLERDFQSEGSKIKHFDTKEKRTKYENENNLKR